MGDGDADVRQFNYVATGARVAGILLHPTSLPGPHPVGDFGPAAYRFVDWLCAAGLRLWQTLPLSMTDEENSPYGSLSVFAGTSLLISLELLAEDGLLTPEEAAGDPSSAAEASRVDYATAAQIKAPLLRLAAERFWQRDPVDPLRQKLEAFRHRSPWLADHCMFMALSRENGGAPWQEWTRYVDASKRPVESARHDLADEIRRHEFLQFIFYRQWNDLRRYAHSKGIAILGDLPIYVAEEGADVWANRDLFQLDETGRPTHVAGVPPDYFAEDGQLWNNPLYDWQAMRADGFTWWIRRMNAVLDEVDMVRLDHFRGYEAYWSVPAQAETARDGEWRPGPCDDFFAALLDALRDRTGETLPLVAEDLGMITDEVTALRRRFHLPGIKVLHFALEHEGDEELLAGEMESNLLLYTGTHDNDTTVGWFHAAIENHPEKLERVRRYLPDATASNIAWRLIEMAWRSPAQMAIAPMQDVLSLDTSARMNVPGSDIRTRQNWVWRMTNDQLRPEQAEALHSLTEASGRLS
jgi:4-alpha-glucanotransferase